MKYRNREIVEEWIALNGMSAIIGTLSALASSSLAGLGLSLAFTTLAICNAVILYRIRNSE